MHESLAALADPARWRLVSLLAERPRSVGVLAQLAGARQPQTTKHLQTLERAGRRHLPAHRPAPRSTHCPPGPLRDLAAELGRGSPTPPTRPAAPARRSTATGSASQAERLAADEDRVGRRPLVRVPPRRCRRAPALVWRHLTETDAARPLVDAGRPPRLRARLRGASGRAGRPGVPRRRGRRRLRRGRRARRGSRRRRTPRPSASPTGSSPLLPDGSVAFTSHVDLRPAARAATAPTSPSTYRHHRQHRRLGRLRRGHRDRLRPEPRQARRRPSAQHRARPATTPTTTTEAGAPHDPRRPAAAGSSPT